MKIAILTDSNGKVHRAITAPDEKALQNIIQEQRLLGGEWHIVDAVDLDDLTKLDE
jgi:hypothetical protein